MKISLPKILLCALLLFSACATRSAQVPTMEAYLEVEDGETREEILQKFGPPVSIEVQDDGTEIFKYIERFTINQKVVDARTYYFFIKDGKVVGKIAEAESRPQVIDSDKL